MQLDVGPHIMQSSCVECCVKLLVFAHTSACVCVSCSCSSDAHDFFAECFSGCRPSIGRRRVTATRDLQHDTSLRKFFVLGALVPAMLLASWSVRPPSMTGGGQSDPSGRTALNFLKCTRPVRTTAQQSIKSNVFRWTFRQLRSEFRTTMRIKGNFFTSMFPRWQFASPCRDLVW